MMEPGSSLCWAPFARGPPVASPLLCQNRTTHAPKALPLHFKAEEPPAPGGVDGDFKMAVFGDKGVGL